MRHLFLFVLLYLGISSNQIFGNKNIDMIEHNLKKYIEMNKEETQLNLLFNSNYVSRGKDDHFGFEPLFFEKHFGLSVASPVYISFANFDINSPDKITFSPSDDLWDQVPSLKSDSELERLILSKAQEMLTAIARVNMGGYRATDSTIYFYYGYPNYQLIYSLKNIQQQSFRYLIQLAPKWYYYDKNVKVDSKLIHKLSFKAYKSIAPRSEYFHLNRKDRKERSKKLIYVRQDLRKEE